MAETFTLPIDTSKPSNTTSPVRTDTKDKLYVRFISEGTTIASTAVVSYYSQRDLGEPPLFEATITVDGAVNELDVSKFAFVSFAVTAIQSNTKGTLAIYTRKNQE